jgi:hypothetical protein
MCELDPLLVLHKRELSPLITDTRWNSSQGIKQEETVYEVGTFSHRKLGQADFLSIIALHLGFKSIAKLL